MIPLSIRQALWILIGFVLVDIVIALFYLRPKALAREDPGVYMLWKPVLIILFILLAMSILFLWQWDYFF